MGRLAGTAAAGAAVLNSSPHGYGDNGHPGTTSLSARRARARIRCTRR